MQHSSNLIRDFSAKDIALSGRTVLFGDRYSSFKALNNLVVGATIGRPYIGSGFIRIGGVFSILFSLLPFLYFVHDLMPDRGSRSTRNAGGF